MDPKSSFMPPTITHLFLPPRMTQLQNKNLKKATSLLLFRLSLTAESLKIKSTSDFSALALDIPVSPLHPSAITPALPLLLSYGMTIWKRTMWTKMGTFDTGTMKLKFPGCTTKKSKSWLPMTTKSLINWRLSGQLIKVLVAYTCGS